MNIAGDQIMFHMTPTVVIALLLGLLIYKLSYTSEAATFNRGQQLLAECEASLPRDQNCILYAKPEE